METNEIYWVIAISTTIKTLDDLQFDGEYSSLDEAKEFAEKVELSDIRDMRYNKVVVRSSDSYNDLYSKELE